MHQQRFLALQKAISKNSAHLNSTSQVPSEPISHYFGSHSFGLGNMREKLSKEAYQDLLWSLDHGKKLSKDTADAIALVVKDWSVNQGATHFCHWFQPMTGLTAEKHDAFVSIHHSHHSELSVIEKFTSSQLIQGEPDASSFPNGGMRSTFEARGYTAWDPSSPLFILEDGNTKTLCIPCVFFGYHGQALDMKTPLLRSTEVISQKACEFLKLLGDIDVKRVNCTLGAEQEYFLIDKNFISLRPDIYMTGRSLLGATTARGQQFEDHYFGAIPTRVKNFMADAEKELFQLGIPVKTRHNEVAPSQFELAPIFEDLNIAVDHNVLTMETLRRVALKHGLICLLHEKPFAGVNGSGKHCNWSIANDKGENLLEPGSTPHQNLRFLAILAVILNAVYRHADILRASIASAGNDHRLGANEAPPAIISVFLGGLLDDILESIEHKRELKASAKEIIDLGISKIPDVSKDYTDRNRTSPFAFTGNKFEFRAVGSSANPSYPMMILNAAVSEAFDIASKELKPMLVNSDRDEAILNWVRSSIQNSKTIRFAGNGYSDDWKLEAKKRGLPIASNSVEAFKFFGDLDRVKFLLDLKVLSKEELESHHHIFVEKYNKSIELEAKVLLDMAQTIVAPQIERHLSKKIQLLGAISQLSARTQELYQADLEKDQQLVQNLLPAISELTLAIQTIENTENIFAKAESIMKALKPAIDSLRDSCDQIELRLSDESWSIPKYREMLLSHSLT